MGQSKDFRTITGSAPNIGQTGLSNVYADGSGRLKFTTTNNSGYLVGSWYNATGSNAAVSTGQVVWTNNGTLGVNVTGLGYGTTGVNPLANPIILLAPNVWFNVFGPDGSTYSLPAYTRTF